MLTANAERLHRHTEVLVFLEVIISPVTASSGKLAINRVELFKVIAAKLLKLGIVLHFADLHQVFTNAVYVLAIKSGLLKLCQSHSLDCSAHLSTMDIFTWLPRVSVLCVLSVRRLMH